MEIKIFEISLHYKFGTKIYILLNNFQQACICFVYTIIVLKSLEKFIEIILFFAKQIKSSKGFMAIKKSCIF